MLSSASLAPPSPHNRALMWFAAGVVAAALWLAINLSFPLLQQTGIPSTITRLLIHAVILGGLWFAIERSSLGAAQRM
jgi:hypothetical protein